MKTIRTSNSCQSCELIYGCLSLGLGKEQQDKFSHLITEVIELKKNEWLYHAGDRFKFLYAVKEGALKTVRFDENGSEAILDFFLPGEIVGFAAIHSESYINNAIALCKTSVCRIPFEHLSLLAANNIDIQKQLFCLLSLRIERQQSLHFHFDAEQKLAAFLLDISQRLAQIDSFALPASQQDIANYLQLTPETVSRLFHKFRRQGIIESLEHRHITGLDHAKLHNILQKEE